MQHLKECIPCDDNQKDLKRIKKHIANFLKFRELSSFAICSTFILLSAILIQASKASAVYSNADFMTKPNFEPLCSTQEERFVESEGKESSLILEFNSAHSSKSCTRILSAPPSYGFIVRLILPKIRRSGNRYHAATVSQPSSASASSSVSATMNSVRNNQKAKTTTTTSALNEMTTLIERLNATALKANSNGRTCPLTIFSSLDPHTPQWRVDPCQLEDTAPEMEDPVRLFHGRIRIVWEHGAQTLHSKLMVTALGKGEQCQSEMKHQCLKIGDEPLLCISKQLVCDGIRHCPYSNEYDSDEDYAMCWKRRRFGEPMPPAMDSDIFEHFALEVFRNLFAFDTPTMPDLGRTRAPITTIMTATSDVPTLRKQQGIGNDEENGIMGKNAFNMTDTMPKKSENGTETATHGRRNSTRSGLSSDFSKYGPWGYLMLGMLLCGGALLICGLWASASQHAANNEREAALQNAAAGFNSSLDHQSGGTSPPNYEELDPPPAYSVLFPNQKAGSSATLSSLAAAAMAVPATPILPATAITNDNTNGNNATTTATSMTIAANQCPTMPSAMTRTASLSDTASSSAQTMSSRS